MNTPLGTLYNQAEVVKLLRLAPWSEELARAGYKPFLASEVAAKRAELVVKTARATGIEWNLDLASTIHKFSVPYYEIPDSDFGATTDVQQAHASQKAHGIGLNWGSLQRFSRACEIGNRHFGKEWPLKFKGKLANPKDHLSFIEEIIWLSSWGDITGIESEAKLWKHLGSNKAIDWRFMSAGQVINLEVKYRARDWVRHVDGPAFNIVKPSYYSDVDGKFRERRAGELNIVGVSSYAPPDRSWQEETHEYLHNNPQIDAIVLWSPGFSSPDGTGPFEIQSKNKPLIRQLLKVVPEDSQHMVVVRHPWRERDERREARAGDVIAAQAQYPARALKRILGDDPNSP